MTNSSRLATLGARLSLAAALGILGAHSLGAQSLAQRVATAGTGAVTFHYAARPGVCGDGEHFVRTGRSQYVGSWSKDYARHACEFGPVQVRLTLEDGSVTRVQYWVGRPRERQAQDIGEVSAPEAARYLLSIAARGSPSAASKAIFPAVLADSATIWPALLAIAKDNETRSHGTRREATLWLSRFASGAVAGHPNQPFDDDDDDQASDDESVKLNAVFVLSQLRGGAGIPDLLDIARKNHDARVRGQAMFWLGESGDPRALALFESVLGS